MIGTDKRTNMAVLWAVLFGMGLLLVLFDLDGELNSILLVTCLLFAAAILYALKDIQGRVFFLCFLLAFFTFLLGGEVLERYFDIFSSSFSEDIDRHADICLLISLSGLFAGYVISEKYGHRIRVVTLYSRKRQLDYDGVYCRCVRTISKHLFFVTFLVWIFVLWRQISYVQQYGYEAYYLHYSSGLPQIVHTVANMAPVAFCVFAAAMPTKKEAMLPIILYLVRAVLSLGTGRRLSFMVGLLFVFAYLLIRNKYQSRGEVWFSKRMGIILIIAAPFLLMGMYLFEYIRSDTFASSASRFNPLFGFFARQGISVNVIKYAERYKDSMNPGAMYSLYNSAKFLQTNTLNQYAFGFDFGYLSSGQTVENALNTNSLANFISYQISEQNYLNGVGIGSCFIAELYVDFGYAGVLLGSFLYGYLLQSLYEHAISAHSIWITAVGLYVAEFLIRANRSTFDAFLTEPLYLPFWGTLLLIHLAARYYALHRE